MSFHPTIVDKSLLGNQWVFRNCDLDLKQQLQMQGNYHEVLSHILASRGINMSDAAYFLDPKIKNLMPDPLHLLGVSESVSRIIDAVNQKQKIGILGDYDVDGACASAILSDFLKQCGGDVLVRIPDRIKDGYGPSISLVDQFISENCKLLITLDCGSMSFEPLAYAHSQGLDVIVIDHHGMTNEMPQAFSIINPKRPDQKTDLQILCAAGVVFFVMVALRKELQNQGCIVPDLLTYLDRVALATVCDVVPLQGINRAFVQTGLKILNADPCLGLKILSQNLNIEGPVNSYHLGYMLGPHINAGGRVDQADTGFHLLSTKDPLRAQGLSLLAIEQNKKRKILEHGALLDAIKIADQKKHNSVLVLYNPDWHVGILGIIASRIKEQYHKPTIVLSQCNGVIKGSARSVIGTDMGALMHMAVAQKIIHGGGGHAMAAGMTLGVEQIDSFESFVNNQKLSSDHNPQIFVDSQVAIPALDMDFLNHLERLEPFGSENPAPVFLLKNIQIQYARLVGDKHVQVKFIDMWGNSLAAILFQSQQNSVGDFLLNQTKQQFHCIGTVKNNTWNHKKSLQFQITDICLAA